MLKDMHGFDGPSEDVNILMERENCELVRLANYLMGSEEAVNNTLKARPLFPLSDNLKSSANACWAAKMQSIMANKAEQYEKHAGIYS